MKVSVAIITRNRNKLLEKCLQSLVRQVIKPFEVIVVNNASSDETKKIILSFKDKLPIESFFEKKIGIPYARNRALKEAKGDILAFVDDDVIVSQDWLAKIILAHRKFPSAIAIQGYFLNPQNDNITASITNLSQNEWLRTHIALSLRKFKHLINNPEQEGVEISTIVTRNCSFKLPLLKRMRNTFNTEFIRWSDTDFSRQLREKKQKIIFYPSLRGNQIIDPSLKNSLLTHFARGRWRYRLDKKWRFEQVQVRESLKINFFYLFPSLLRQKKQFGRIVSHITLFYAYRILFIMGYWYEKYIKSINGYTEIFLKHANAKKSYYCFVCKNYVGHFLPIENQRSMAICPICGSRERYRLLTLFLERETNFFSKKGGSVLEIGPASGFSRLCRHNRNIEYQSVDTLKRRADKQMNITDLRFHSEYFDFIICSHVLEHVKDDEMAIKEMYRVLKRNGTCFIMVPLDKKRKKTFEESKNDLSAKKRERLFGQKDHVRIYGADFIQRLQKYGFSVEVVDYTKKLSSVEKERYGIKQVYTARLYKTSDEIYICRRNN